MSTQILEPPPTASAPEPPVTVSPEERERRLLLLTEALLAGDLPRELVDRAVQHWQVSRRTAQAYVQDANARLHADAAELPPRFALEFSQLQRNRLLHGLLLRTRRLEPADDAAHCRLVGMTLRVLDSRDRTSVRLLSMQMKQQSAETDQCVERIHAELRELEARDKAFLRRRESANASHPEHEADGAASGVTQVSGPANDPPLTGGRILYDDDAEPEAPTGPTTCPADRSSAAGADEDSESSSDDEAEEMDRLDYGEEVAEWLDEIDPLPDDADPAEADAALWAVLDKLPPDQWLAYAKAHYHPRQPKPNPAPEAKSRPSDPAQSPSQPASHVHSASLNARADACADSAAGPRMPEPVSHNPLPHRHLPTTREERRKEKKRLRRLRKRTRGQC